MLKVQRIAHASPAIRGRPTLVFLHDSLGCIATWRDFPETLAGLVELDAIVYDREGYGGSSPMSSAPRTARYLEREAERLFELLDILGVADVVLFGHSDGGSIALVSAALQPHRVRAIVTEGAHIFVEEETLAGIRAAAESFRTTDLAERLEKYHGDKVASIASAWIETWTSSMFRDWSIESYLQRAACRALIIQGSDDEFGTIAQVRGILAGMPGRVESLLMPGVGHTPHREARALVLERATEFIRRAVAE